MDLSKQSQLVGVEKQLPASCYTDSDFFDLEWRQLFEPGWVSIGFASTVAEPGQVCPVTVNSRPLVITRDLQGELHVFENVCRHRGHLVAAQPCSKQNLLTCPYHAWSYGLDGQFVNAPYWDGQKKSAPGSDIKSKLGLIAVRFAVWYDIIFVNLSGTAQGFEDFIEPLQARWSGLRDPELLQGFSYRDYVAPGNWKLAAENFLDNYHLPWIHPQLGSSIESSLGLEAENLQLGDNIMGFSLPGAAEEKAKTRSPLPAWPALNPAQQSIQELFVVFPNTCLVVEGNYLWSMLLLPESAQKCAEKIALYVVGESALLDQHADSRQQLAQAIYQINEQDQLVIAGLQKGRYSAAASEGVFNLTHDQLGQWFHQAVSGKMGC